MAKFKVKYPTRRRLQRAIMQVIQREGLTDTYVMKDSIRISAVGGDNNEMIITINAIYYYMFQDLGASDAGRGRNIDLRPHNITEKAFRTNQGKKFLAEVVQAYMDFVTNNPKFNILDLANLQITPKMIIEYNLFGDPSGKWNGTFRSEEAVAIQWDEA